MIKDRRARCCERRRAADASARRVRQHRRDLGASPRSGASIEIARQDQLQRDLVRRVGESKSYARLKIQGLGRVIDDPVELMGLLIAGVELVDGSEIVVFLDGKGPGTGQIAADAGPRPEAQVVQPALAGLEDRIN